MKISQVLIYKLNVRKEFSLDYETVWNFNSGQIINREEELRLN